jgi:hypothetical protein
MKLIMQKLIVAASVALVASIAVAAPPSAKPVKLAKAAAPNCEINGKKSHVKDQGACEKKKGKWLDTSVAAPTPVKEQAPAKDAPAAASAPATEEKK